MKELDKNIKELIAEYKVKNHIYDEKVDLDEHGFNLIKKFMYEKFVFCEDCRYKYIKAMNAYCPFKSGPINVGGFCEHGKK